MSWAIVAGAVLMRGIALVLAPLLQTTSFGVVGIALADLKPALLALLVLAEPKGARRAFSVALLAMALGAAVDALTPSYDGSVLWGWASEGLLYLSELATLGGLAFLARAAGANRASVVVLGLATVGSLVRRYLHDDQFLWLAIVLALAGAGHVLLFPSLRRRAREKAAPRPFPEAAGRGLFRWGIVEAVRLVLYGGCVAVGAALSLSDRDFGQLAMGVYLATAVLSAVGLRWLYRFTDGAFGLGVRCAAARALPLASVVMGLFALPDLVEGLLGRDAAGARAIIGAVASVVVGCVGSFSVAGAGHRSARALELPRLARALSIVRWLMVGVPSAIVAVLVLQELVSWRLRRELQDAAAVLAIGFMAVWIASVVMLLVAGRALGAHRAPGGVGEKIANAS